MEAVFLKLWPVINQAGAASAIIMTVVVVLLLRDKKQILADHKELREENKELRGELIKISEKALTGLNEASKNIERNAGVVQSLQSYLQGVFHNRGAQ